MRGIVQFVDARLGRAVIETSSGSTVVEITDAFELELEDEVSGDLESCGSAVLRHHPSGEAFDVFIQGVGASREEAFRTVGRQRGAPRRTR